MRYAILSDLHANLQAWNAALLDIRSIGVDAIICLGDVVGYGPDPVAVLESAYTHIDHFVLGNHDAVVCGKLSADLFNDKARDLILWTRSQVGSNAVRFLKSLPLTLDGGSFRCTHGEFSRPAAFDYVFEPEEAVPSWQSMDSNLLFVGHTHVPGIFLLGQSGTPHLVPPRDFEMEAHKRYLVNVGSVGQPRDGDARACYCVHDTSTGTVIWRRIPFDIDAYRSSMTTRGLDTTTTYFLRHDPRDGKPALRASMNFSPPGTEADYVHHTVEVRTLDKLQRSVSLWRRLTLLGLCLGMALAALTAGLWGRHHRRSDEIVGLMPSAISSVSAPLDRNLVTMPETPVSAGRPVAGWRIHLGDKRHQAVSVQVIEDEYAFVLASQQARDGLWIESPPIRVQHHMTIRIFGLFKKSDDFRGNIAMVLSLTKDTADGRTTIQDFIVKEPNQKRTGGWMAAQVTEDIPADTIEATLRIRGHFTGQITVRGIEVIRRK